MPGLDAMNGTDVGQIPTTYYLWEDGRVFCHYVILEGSELMDKWSEVTADAPWLASTDKQQESER